MSRGHCRMKAEEERDVLRALENEGGRGKKFPAGTVESRRRGKMYLACTVE